MTASAWVETALGLLRRLDEEATAGPWRVHRAPGSPSCSVRALRGAVIVADVVTGPAGTAEAISTLRTLLPELVAVVDAAREVTYSAERYTGSPNPGPRWTEEAALSAALDALDDAARKVTAARGEQ